MALISKETEYVSLAACVQKVLWFKRFVGVLDTVLEKKTSKLCQHFDE